MSGWIGDLLGGLFGGDEGSTEPTKAVEATDPWDELEVEERDGGMDLAGTVTLPEGTFASQKLPQNGDMAFEASLDAGETGPFDCYLVPDYFVDGYRDGGAFASDTATSRAGVSAAAAYQGELSVSDNGDHHVVFDNTARGDTVPTGEVTIDFEISVRPNGNGGGDETA